MKNLFLLILVSFSLIACQTTVDPNPIPNPGPTPGQIESVTRASSIVEMSAQLSTYFILKSQPDARVYFESAVLVLNLAVNRGDYSPTSLSNILSRITVNNSSSEIVYISVSAALTLYKIVWADAVNRNLDKNLYVRPVLVALSNGVALGLNSLVTERKLEAINRSRQ